MNGTKRKGDEKMMTESEKKIGEAFRGVFPDQAVYEFHYSPQTFVIRVYEPGLHENKMVDEFCVEEKGGDIVWYDFTHTTNLGPIDGSKLQKKLEEWDARKDEGGK
jgi:hypothetical protein